MPFTLDEEFTEHDNYENIGPFGGEAGFIASRDVSAGQALDAAWQFDQSVGRSMALVVTVTATS